MQSFIVSFMITAFIVYFSLPPQARAGKPVFAPMGHVKFCQKNPSECRAYKGRKKLKRKRVTLSKRNWQQLVSVNAQVNKAITSRTDQKNHNQLDVWSTKGRYGDCEDYALRKRKLLIQKGWPSRSLLITTARDHKGRPHAVLIVKTSKGDYVLDNLRRTVSLRSKVPYQWLKQQSTKNPKRWVALSGYRKHASKMTGNTRFKSKYQARKYLNKVLAKLKKQQKRKHYAKQRLY